MKKLLVALLAAAVLASMAAAPVLAATLEKAPEGPPAPVIEKLAGVPDDLAAFEGLTREPAAAAASQGKAGIVLADLNGNKVMDYLDDLLAVSQAGDRLPVIVRLDQAAGPFLKAAAARVGNFVPSFVYDAAFDGFASTLTKAQIELLQHLPGIVRVEYDLPVYATLSTASSSFGVAKARTDFGVTGNKDGNLTSYSKNDIVVAVIDTGIDAAHVDLDGGKVIGWKDYVNSRTTPYDDNGHGTHCSSIAAGSGDGNVNYRGVAYGAALVGVKVLNAAGSGSMSTVDAGINWCISNKATYNIRVISLSLGTSGSSDGTDSTSVAVNNAYSNGIVAVVAAGNSGPARYTIGSPGAAANAITVGAMADTGEKGFYLASFSSRGPTADGRTKPDIASPGVNITAAKANSANQYVSYSGTSMATPFTAGTAALMLAANPGLTPAQVKSTITGTAQGWGPAGQDVDYGYGRLQAYEAIKSAGGFTGTGPAVPTHAYQTASLTGAGDYDNWSLSVTSTAYPLAVTLIMPNWTGSSTPDFDLYVYNPSGTQVGSSYGTKRQETVYFTPTATGTYTIKVTSYTGSGTYFFDVSYK